MLHVKVSDTRNFTEISYYGSLVSIMTNNIYFLIYIQHLL